MSATRLSAGKRGVNFIEQCVHLASCIFIDPLEGEPRVYQYIVADVHIVEQMEPRSGAYTARFDFGEVTVDDKNFHWNS